MITHNPECASIKNFEPIPWENKTLNAVLYGSWYEYLYPLRCRLRTGIKSGRIQRSEIYKYPLDGDTNGFNEWVFNNATLNHPRTVQKKKFLNLIHLCFFSV